MKLNHLIGSIALLVASLLPALAIPSNANVEGVGALSTRRTAPRKELWKPAVGTPWQIVLSEVIKIPKGGAKNLKPNVPIYDVDLFENPKKTFDALHKAGKRVICYFSAGSWENWRDDRKDFQKKDLGKTLSGWPDEKYVNISSPSVRAIMAKRIKLAAQKGCDAIDPDNMDGYVSHDSNFNEAMSDVFLSKPTMVWASPRPIQSHTSSFSPGRRQSIV